MEDDNEKEQKKDISLQDKVKCKVEELIEYLINNDLKTDDVSCLGELVDIHKDLENEEYWKVKEEYYMRYRGYGDSYGAYGDSYGEDYERRSRDSRGRYTEGSYGRRGVDGSGRGRYRGHDMLDEMSYSYGAYAEGNEYGNSYGTGVKELEKMLDCNVALIEHLKKNAKSQEEIEVIEKKVQEMSML